MLVHKLNGTINWFLGGEERNGGGLNSEMPLSVASMADAQYSGAVIPTESVHINLERGTLNRSVDGGDVPDTAGHMRNVDLHNGNAAASTTGIIRQGFGKSI